MIVFDIDIIGFWPFQVRSLFWNRPKSTLSSQTWSQVDPECSKWVLQVKTKESVLIFVGLLQRWAVKVNPELGACSKYTLPRSLIFGKFSTRLLGVIDAFDQVA